MPALPPLHLEQAISLACTWEVCVPKLGNVHRSADFGDTALYDFVTSVPLMAHILAGGGSRARVGTAIREAVVVSRQATRGNTHLGTILLLGPLCAVPRGEPIETGIAAVLAGLNDVDAADVYSAIRAAQPGGLGEVSNWDVAGASPPQLLEAMALAADRDRVARQYCCNFADVLQVIRPRLVASIQREGLVHGILREQLRMMEAWPDSLIARKCGMEVAQEASAWASHLCDEWPLGMPPPEEQMSDFDFWLRSDGNRRNPGTTADLLAAALFAALRDGQLSSFSYEVPGP